MVRFAVFNDYSLPFLSDENINEKFIEFFKLLAEINNKGLSTLRVSKDFKNYIIFKSVNFQQFLGKQSDLDFQRKIRSFLANNTILIDSPLIKENENEAQDMIYSCEYIYKNKPTESGLACCDIWNTVAVSFNSDNQWNADNIILKKNNISNNSEIIVDDISIKHCSKIEHLTSHQVFFNALEQEIKLGITQNNFWNKREDFFKRIVFCSEVEEKIVKLDKRTFQLAVSLLRDVETQRKLITDYNYSVEGKTVKTNPKFRELREFTINAKKVFFESHIKSLPNGCRIYFLEENGKIYIGYIGKHLKGKKDK